MKLHKGINRILLMLAVALLSTGGATAAPVSYDFSVSFLEGELAGQDFVGRLEVEGDDIAPGLVFFDPSGFEGLLISLNITIDGVDINETDDDGYPFFPFVILRDGDLVGIDVVAVVNNLEYYFILDDTFSEAVVIDNLTGEVLSSGIVSASANVPVPAGGLLLFSALGISAIFRRKIVSN